MASEIDFISSYLYRAVISGESQLSTNIPQVSSGTFYQQHRIDIYFVEIPFFENLPRKSIRHIISLK